ncbi:MAG: TonB-dependent receptor plug domain-containing protein [Gemmatimonadetes bacterium]|nr:TonB-dependent receptor plug domain-containing protein [Gemmatimonadota bacterium]MXX72503.1 TonB-dependent receptor plug domain-containing protein [Gemmatimonadota bacterium]MYB06728.1 TonB-dependent receptor plug domain-containing protein [Gemmatimonadota bacterium]MYG22152.1 TonB-dependent receptor plug domain-containing protein [Gemmatimonadota bacterium]MYG36042.1 TonB-dependent receptor plug domain-containing protein [Gemmatimonadota bacterium]
MRGATRMRKKRNDLGVIALIAGAGAVGVLATMFAVVATRGPAAAPEQVDARQQAVAELTERLSERLSEASERVEAQRIRVRGTVTSEGARVRIRSSEPLESGGEPIIYIDGVRVEGDRDEAMQLLTPDQIDRVEVLKGDAAKELYGSEARNGVIQIFTKTKEGS